uniref:BRO1 domain-containing protein n=1 Tax=Photinus pyralis TaxID=7054 RepID=A0A1Y1LGS8_PHOPY
MADLLSVPLKKPSEVDIVNPLKNLIQSRYSTADQPEDYSEQINEFSKLRNNAIWRAFEKYESSLEVIYSYYDQLVSLETKVPAQEVQIPFKWKDAFDKGSIFGGRISLTISSLAYEKMCILFNIAALQSSVAATQSVENDESLKLAAKLLQQAAGIFSHLKSTVMLSIQQDPTPDLNPDTLGALSALMLAQAQEIFVLKAIHDEMKDQIVAKLSSQCEDLYSECLKMFQRENLKQLWDRDWIATIAGKQAGYHAIAEYYQSLVCKSNKIIGEQITRLESAMELFKAAQTRSGKAAMFQDFANKAQRNLNEAKKDNDFIYHERIPDIKSVAAIGKAQLAKIVPLGYPLSQNFQDLFSELVPVVVHQAMAAYELRKNEIQNGEISKLRDSTQFLNSVLASLNLPAAIEVTQGGNSLPPSILEKSEAVRQLGGITHLNSLITELPELLKRNQDILDEADRMLNEEKQSDDSLRAQFKERWTRTPSDKLTEMFRSNAAKYRQIINNAIQADKTVREKFESHRMGMELLSKSPGELQSAVPAGPGGSVSNSSAVQTLRQLMEEVETVKAERDVIETELKSATVDMKEQFLSSLSNDGGINEPALSMESIGRSFGPLQKQVKESIDKQEDLIARIQSAHQQFSQETGTSAGGRDSMMCHLAAAHDAFRDLQSNLKEGAQFYNDLTQLLVVFQNKISDYCFARKTEKEELMKDLTQECSRQTTPLPPPSQPSFHNEVKKTEPSPTSPTSAPPVQTSSNLPYPVYVQGMPVPFAPGSAPYTAYAPPPMPQSYNPYGGGYQQAPYNYAGGYPPQQGYPGGYPQQGNYPQGNYPQQSYPPGTYPQQQHPRGW